jgi:preprotein translocase SecE subunit
VARDRQRAKQRKARRAGRAQNPGPPRSKLERADLPGELEHASGEVEEFEAALVSGADGEPDDAFEDEEPEVAGAFAEGEEVEGVYADELSDDDDAELSDDDAVLEEEAVAAAPAEHREVAAAPTPGTPTRRGPARFIGFLRASWAELQRVQWPDRRAVGQATAVVIGFVVVAGLYLGVADWVAKKIVDFII